MKRLWGMLGFMCLVLGSALAADRYVAPGGGNTPPYESWGAASTDLKAAVDVANAADAGETVWVSNGVYVLTDMVTVNNTIVQGFTGNGPAIVDGAGTYTCFKLANSNAVVDGLTISNGQAWVTHSYKGGGAYLQDGTLRNCLFVNNTALTNTGYSPATGGGGAYMENAGTLISNCVFRDNHAVWGPVTFPYSAQGGGIYMKDGQVVDCQFYNNTSTNGSGGGIYMAASGSVYNCHLSGNWCKVRGGGAYVTGGTLANCQMVGNSSVTGQGDQTGGGVYLGSASALLVNSTVASNYSAGYGVGVGIEYGMASNK